MSKLKAAEISADKWTNSDGSENFRCRAWVNFNGTGTLAINASGNVSSVTDNGVGTYTVNFATAMPDNKYAITFGSTDIQGGEATPKVLTDSSAGNPPKLKTASAVMIGHVNGGDTNDFSVVVFR